MVLRVDAMVLLFSMEGGGVCLCIAITPSGMAFCKKILASLAPRDYIFTVYNYYGR